MWAEHIQHATVLHHEVPVLASELHECDRPASPVVGVSEKKTAKIGSPTVSSSPSPISRPPTPFCSINDVLTHRESSPACLPGFEKQDSDSDSCSSITTTSVSYEYSVKSVNSRKSRTTVLHPRPVRPLRMFGVESTPGSSGDHLESLNLLSTRPVSLPVTDVTETLSLLFEASPGDDSRAVEYRLSSSWTSLLKIKAYEENDTAPNLRATGTYADTLLRVHSEIVARHLVGAQELTRPCARLNEAFEGAYVLLSNSGAIPHVLEHILALDANILKDFVVTIMQLSRLISALEVLIDFLSMLTIFKASNIMPKTEVHHVISNVPGQRQRKGSQPTLSSAEVMPDVNDMLLLLSTRNDELDQELRGLRLLLWRVKPKAKAEMENIVKLLLPFHHEELTKGCVEDFVVNWQTAMVLSGHGIDNRMLESDDRHSHAGEERINMPNTESFALALAGN